jgi:hypothetical protein
MKKFTIILALCSVLAAHSQSDPSWATKKELGFNLNARQDAGMVALGTDLYILGGMANCGPKNFLKYNTQTSLITQLKNLGTGCANPIYDGVLFTQGTKIYSFHGNGNNVYDTTTNEWTNYPFAAGLNPDTGFMIDNNIYITSKTGGNIFYAFNTLTNTFTQKANYPGSPNRRGAMSFDIAGKGYLVGGTVLGFNNCTTELGCFTSNVFEYNPVTDTWISKAGMPKAIVFGSAISQNGKGYAGLGEIYISNISQRVKSAFWYEYNPLTDTWTVMQNYMNLASTNYVNTVSESAIAKINNDIFIFGGRSGGVFEIYLDDITKYNTTTNTWAVVNSDPGKNRTEAAGFFANGKIYVGGGHDSEGLVDFWEYTIATNTWSQKANWPSSHTQRACVALDGKGYFIGGYGKSVLNTTSNPNANYLDSLLEYDPITNLFTAKAALPFKRGGMFALVHDGKIYAGSGFNSSGQPSTNFNMYNPQTNTWTAKAAAPFTGANLSSFVLGDTGYVITFNPTALVGKYNFLTDTWTTVSHNLPNFNSAEYSNQAFVFNGDAYIVHGNATEVDRLSKFNPINDTWIQISNIPFKSAGNTIIATPSEIYFGFGIGGVTADLGIHHSNAWSALKFGANVSDEVGLYSTQIINFFTSNCGTVSLTNGAKQSINDGNGDLFMAVEAQDSAFVSACMEVSSTALTIPFQSDAANYGNGFIENALFLNKNLLLVNNSSIGNGGIVRLYYTQFELQKLVTDFNATYGLNKTISDIKIVRYFENSLNDHNIANNNNANSYSTLTATLNNYGIDYYFEIICTNSGNTVFGEIRAALLTGQNLGVENPTIAKITMYPNPTNSILNIQTEEQIKAITARDLYGRTTVIKAISANSFDVSALSTGIYLIEVRTAHGFFREKFIKN